MRFCKEYLLSPVGVPHKAPFGAYLMELETVHSIIRRAETNYLEGSTKLGKYVEWSMHDTIERIDAYLNSKHTSGAEDSLGRPKPFFNVVTAAVNIWYRATDIDRKDIKFVPTKSSSVVLAFIANVMLQNWMDKNRFGQFLNQWGRSLSRYGSTITKFIDVDGQLIPSVIPWNRYIADPVQFDALPRIEKFYKTPAQLLEMATPGSPNYTGYDLEAVESLIESRATRKTLDDHQKDNMNDFIELYEVHGELDTRLLDKNPDLDIDNKDIRYRQQMHVVSFTQESSGKYKDFTVFKGKENKDPYQKDDLIEEDGRTLGIGAVEYLFDAQWMQNHTVKNMKDTLDLASRLIFQTADTNYVGKNVLSAIETGDILTHADNKPLTRVANDSPSIVALQNFGTMWQSMARELTSTPDALRGNTLPSGTPYALGQFLGTQANSLFEIMTENKGLAIEDMMRKYVIPHLKRQLKNKEEIAAILDDAGIQEIDALYVPFRAVKRFNEQAKKDLINGIVPSPYQQDIQQQQVQQEMATMGNKRFFKPDELDQKTWDEIFSDFEWDSIRVEVVNENTDKKAVLQTLSTSLQTIASNPAILKDPNAKMLFSAILTETGRISPLQLSTAAAQPIPTPTVTPSAGGGTGELPVS